MNYDNVQCMYNSTVELNFVWEKNQSLLYFFDTLPHTKFLLVWKKMLSEIKKNNFRASLCLACLKKWV